MNQFFLMSWVVVDRETKLYWKWFLYCIQDYLELEQGEHMTLMSNMQKVSYIKKYSLVNEYV